MIIYYAHGGSDNHGCEAIIRGTRTNLDEPSILYSGNIKADQLYGLQNLCELRPDSYKRYYHPVKWAYYRMLNKVIKKNTMFQLVDGSEKGVYLSVGGDNYCYPGLIEPIIKANSRIRQRGNKTILWGTSIENDVLENEKTFSDIASYDYIFARESVTYNALIRHGLKEKCFLYPDPAFAMMPVKTDKLDDIFSKEVIGINISPLIMKYENTDNVIEKGYEEIIDYVLKNSDTNILFVPHVVKRNNNDLSAIKKLAEKKDSKRICVAEDMSADKLKYLISRCSFFIGARTHSTIAAYSTCVPTLVVGYSVKAIGIAADLFGSDDGYVVDVRKISDPSELLSAFKKIYQKKNNVKKHLKSMMPDYISKTKEAAEKLKELVM